MLAKSSPFSRRHIYGQLSTAELTALDMSSSSEIASHSKNSESVAPSTDDIEGKATAETKRKATAMTRRMSFSMTRPWSSYAENYSSCLSGLRRNSSGNLHSPRKGSLQSSSSITSLSKSLESEQLRDLKTTTSTSEAEKQRPFKVSPLHARPFHQRRWSSPVAFPLVNSRVTSTSPQTSQDLNNEVASRSNVCQNINDKMQNDKICETEEITLQSRCHDQPSVLQAASDITTIEGEERENKQDTKEVMDSTSKAESATNCSVGKGVEENTHTNISSKTHENSPDNTGDKNPEVTTCEINSPTKEETTAPVKAGENLQQRNIYTEIKKSTKWSTSKRFARRRHHTIHTDTRNFLRYNLTTITEQSSNSGSVDPGKETYGGGTLQRRRSRSLDDIKTLREEAENKGVSVQRLYSKSLCVPIGGNTATASNEQKSKSAHTVKNHGEEAERNSMNSINRPVQVNKVNVQTFSYAERSNEVRPQYRAIICGEQPKTIAETKNPAAIRQHAVFTQAKPKWASFTISKV